jgi:hypothetical protein
MVAIISLPTLRIDKLSPLDRYDSSLWKESVQVLVLDFSMKGQSKYNSLH